MTTTATRISELFGAAKPRPLVSRLFRQYTQSGTFVAPAEGWAVTRQMGGGGGGGGGPTATGGSSAAWASKRWRMELGQVLTIAVGAKGLGAAALGTNGSDGGTTTITDGANTVTTLGGKGGIGTAPAIANTGPDGAAYPTGGDFGAAGSKAGNTVAVAGSRTGGAGVDLCAKGNNATRSGNSSAAYASGGGSVTWSSGNAVTGHTWGAGYGGPSTEGFGGPDIFGSVSAGSLGYAALIGDWGIPHFGFGGQGAGIDGQSGGGGAASPDGAANRTGAGGAFAGGGASGSSAWRGGHGGYGGGGGGGHTVAPDGYAGGHGGGGYVWLEFSAEDL